MRTVLALCMAVMLAASAGCGGGGAGSAPSASASPADDKALCTATHRVPAMGVDELLAIGSNAADGATDADLRQAGATLRDRAKAAQADPSRASDAQDALRTMQIVCIHIFGPANF